MARIRLISGGSLRTSGQSASMSVRSPATSALVDAQGAVERIAQLVRAKLAEQIRAGLDVRGKPLPPKEGKRAQYMRTPSTPGVSTGHLWSGLVVEITQSSATRARAFVRAANDRIGAVMAFASGFRKEKQRSGKGYKRSKHATVMRSTRPKARLLGIPPTVRVEIKRIIREHFQIKKGT